jgi:hypothetical protein
VDEEGQPEVRELQEELSRLNSLKAHAGYVYLMEIAQAQLETRKQAVFLTPLKKMDEVLEQEYQKGEISGIALFMQMVDVRIQQLSDEINETLKEAKDNEDFERQTS